MPGANQTLADFGIVLPGAASAQAATGEAASAAAGSAQARAPGRGAGGRGGRTSSVVTSAVVMATINDTLSAIGQGNAIHSVTVGSPSGGKLEELLVSPGDAVKAGQTIGRLDATKEKIDFDLAQLAATDADATLERNQGLARSDLVAGSALATVQLAADKAHLQLRTAEDALERRTIVSPIDGTVGLIQVRPGNYLSAQAAVTTVEDASSILIDFWVPERYATSISKGMPVDVRAVALPGLAIEGVVSAVDNKIDQQSRTLQVEARVANIDNALRPGMSFSVGLKFAGEEFPAVNPLAIQWSAEGSYVWRFDNGKANKVMAEIVQRNSDGVLVKGDLKPGDAVITEGILQLSEGATVTLLDGPGAAAQTNDGPPTRPRSLGTSVSIQQQNERGVCWRHCLCADRCWPS
ncbi:efflux RND transporter periplasmic adaptor subunit [Devosia algicola]|uniref:Efflux RND transporter periplasmic adaptor subunit n=1 Tax=Devosia algicola TaxID=3026418 RepID=A0ABY7YRI2_9HYPH|nr:efflux RND transporter periplasmic adaptor subunit [Devosia algicola]WDR03896.1 efflux RND transporter periplasmic adaptor subunit [Devosia algicola]